MLLSHPHPDELVLAKNNRWIKLSALLGAQNDNDITDYLTLILELSVSLKALTLNWTM